MKDNQASASSVKRAKRRVLIAVALICFVAWCIATIFLLLLGEDWKAHVGSIILLGGLFIAWVVTVQVLEHKNPQYVVELLSDVSEEDGKEQEAMLHSVIRKDS